MNISDIYLDEECNLVSIKVNCSRWNCNKYLRKIKDQISDIEIKNILITEMKYIISAQIRVTGPYHIIIKILRNI